MNGTRLGVQTCTRCIMDTSAAAIHFNDEGICNFCEDFLLETHRFVPQAPEERDAALAALVADVKAQGKGKKYDCIVGVSGGVDSSWALVRAVQLGLRPLAVHMDNGWNSELAQNNIANLVRGLNVDLYTHVIDWNEIRRLMDAFFASDVIDVELLYDNAMTAINFTQATKYGLRHILSGSNSATEGMRMPVNWNWNKTDKRNIVGISRRFGGPKLKTFPSIGTLEYLRYFVVNRIRWVPFLDYLEYRKAATLDVLTKEYGYKPYAYKHYESVFTRFYQGYILPEKFGVDKRKLHLSNLVITDQMSRDEALESASGLPYPSQRELELDKNYFMKKMRWDEKKLADYIGRSEVPHDAYPSEAKLFQFLVGIYRKLRHRSIEAG